MRRIKYIVAIFFAVMLFACEDDLNFPPKSVISSNSMWVSPGDAMGAMYGMFSQFRSAVNDDYIHWG